MFLITEVFIQETATRFLRHLKSIENLIDLDIVSSKEIDKMEIGEVVNHLVELKFQLVKARRQNDTEAIKEYEGFIESFKQKAYNRVIFEQIIVVEEEDEISVQINSPILNNAYEKFIESSLDEIYGVSQFNNSLVVSLVIGLEILISDIFKDYIHHIDISNQIIKDRPLNFHDLKNFESIEDAKNYLLDQYIENLLRDSFDTWLKEFKDTIKIDLRKIQDLNFEIELITETFQRRHLIIHNDGVINDLYLKKVNPQLTTDLSKNDVLEIEPDYIMSRINTIRKFGLILLFEYGKIKHRRNSDEFFEKYHVLLVGLLEKNCDGARYVFKNFSDFNISNKYKLMSQVNYFLSYKLVDDNSVDEEIKRFDVSGLSVDFEMAKSILLNKDDQEKLVLEFFDTLEDGHFINCLDWPLIKFSNKSNVVKDYIKERINDIFEKERSFNES